MTAISLAQAARLATSAARPLPRGSRSIDFQETTAGTSTLGRMMSSRGRKNLPVGSLIFSSAEAHAIRDKCCFVSLTA